MFGQNSFFVVCLYAPRQLESLSFDLISTCPAISIQAKKQNDNTNGRFVLFAQHVGHHTM
jgi:hypothetical protein